jgi:hypothetical protein
MESKKSLRNGSQQLTLDNNLVVNSEELCRIIKMCAKFGVQEVKFKDVHLIFGERDQSPNPGLRPSLASKESQKISEEEFERTSFEKLQDDVEELKLTDPLMFEKLIAGEFDVGSTT